LSAIRLSPISDSNAWTSSPASRTRVVRASLGTTMWLNRTASRRRRVGSSSQVCSTSPRVANASVQSGASNAFFVYLRDPDGHRIELYTGDYLTAAPDLEPIRWSVNDPRRRSFWGQPVPESWYAEASLVAGPDGAPQPVAALDVMSEATAEAI
jgi:hypothetical protein